MSQQSVTCKKCNSVFDVNLDHVKDGRFLCPYCGAKFRQRTEQPTPPPVVDSYSGPGWLLFSTGVLTAAVLGFFAGGYFLNNDKGAQNQNVVADVPLETKTDAPEPEGETAAQATTPATTTVATNTTTPAVNETSSAPVTTLVTTPESVSEHKVTPPVSLPDMSSTTVASTTPAPPHPVIPPSHAVTPPQTSHRAWKAPDGTVLGTGDLVKIVGDQEIIITDGTTETRIPIEPLGEDERRFLRTQKHLLSASAPPLDLPTEDFVPSTDLPMPPPADLNPTRVWLAADGTSLIHGTFLGVSAGGKVRIAPAVRSWSTAEYEPFDGVFFVFFSEIGDPDVYVRIGRVSVPWTKDTHLDIPRIKFSETDQAYLEQIESLKGFAIVSGKSKTLEHFSIPMDRLSKADVGIAIQLDQANYPAE